MHGTFYGIYRMILKFNCKIRKKVLAKILGYETFLSSIFVYAKNDCKFAKKCKELFFAN